MTDLEHILPLWNELESSGKDYVLATVVAVEGSSYRRPGARMLLAQDGRRAGTVSGGCLEAEVARRAWWLTADGPVVQRYSTLDDDGDLPYGSGCGGVVYILLERRRTASLLVAALKAAFEVREALAIAMVLEGPHIGTRAFAGQPQHGWSAPPANGRAYAPWPELEQLARNAFEARLSLNRHISVDGRPVHAWADYRAPRPSLWIFGAGDDARPLHRLARELGWFVAIADGRSHLATPSRFPAADMVRAFEVARLPGQHANPDGNPPDGNLDANPDAQLLPLRPTDAAVLLTHSFEQDSHILAFLLDDERGFPYAYVGVLGPQRRTREALAEAARIRHLPATADQIEHWLAQLHAPTGIDLGADTSPSIALSILAEIQQTLSVATALPLRQVRATRVDVSPAR